NGRSVLGAVVGVTAMTLVNEIPLSLNLYQVDGGADAVPALLAAQQANIDALLAANAPAEAAAPGSAPAAAGGARMVSGAVEGALIGAGVALVLVLLALLFRRRRKSPET